MSPFLATAIICGIILLSLAGLVVVIRDIASEMPGSGKDDETRSEIEKWRDGK